MAQRLPRAETERRTKAMIAGRSAGLDMTQIAADLGLDVRALRSWHQRHRDTLAIPPRAEGGPDPRSEPISPSRRVRVHRDGHVWRVDCGPCRRRFTRSTRAGADRLARLHVRLHPSVIGPTPTSDHPLRAVCDCGLVIVGTRAQIAHAAAAHWDVSDCPWRLTPTTTTERTTHRG